MHLVYELLSVCDIRFIELYPYQVQSHSQKLQFLWSSHDDGIVELPWKKHENKDLTFTNILSNIVQKIEDHFPVLPPHLIKYISIHYHLRRS